MKRKVALFLAVVMLMLTVAGCGSSQGSTTTPTIENLPQSGAGSGNYTFPTIPKDAVTEVTKPEDGAFPVELEDLGYISQSSNLQYEGMEYVMIYNPYLYDEQMNTTAALQTGRIDDQIVVDMNRADGLEEEHEFIPFAQNEKPGLDFQGELEGNRADVMGREFKKGDVEEFYASNRYSMSADRQKQKFTCVYTGEFCNIWSYGNSISATDAQAYAQEFDTNIYTQMVEKFGQPRFDTRVNFLFYPFQDGMLGYFWIRDLLTDAEISYFGMQDYGCNAGVNMLHINSSYLYNSKEILATLAHEFQHLICMTGAFYNQYLLNIPTWLDEAMSGYVEEMIFPGKQYEAGRMHSLMDSSLIRNGQSLYNFTTNTASAETWDIGVYGSVYLYSMYLEALAGEDVFANVHNYWRTSYSNTLCVTEALANAVPEEIYQAVDNSVRYPTAVLFDGFGSEEDIWVSKLTLQFYLDLLDVDDSDPADFRNVDPSYLVYDQLEGATIEGGGRVILRVKNGAFKVPSLAGKGLIYVALDKDFNVLGVSYN